MSVIGKPQNLIDIHSHILPDLDDGSVSVVETKAMLRQAYKDGITCIIATPHFNVYRGQIATRVLSQTRHEQMLEYIKEFPGMKVLLGQEICYNKESMKHLNNGIISTMADTQYILIEYGPKVTKERIHDSLQDALGNGYIPIIAHPERYYCVMDGVVKLEEFLKGGAYIQLNATTVTGQDGKDRQLWALDEIMSGHVQFIASDSHGSVSRKPLLSGAYKIVEKKIGAEVAKKIFIDNPKMLLQNNYLD